MLEIKGKINTAICYAKVVEDEAIEQIRRMCDYDFTENSIIRIMPDVHAGKGCTIGTTMTVHGKAVPNIVGVDIGCGMYTINIGKGEIDFAKLDAAAHFVPSGKNVWEGRQEKFDLEALHCYRQLKNTKRLERSLGTLGGGNHFIEVDRASDGTNYLVIHTGSRNLGKQVAEIYQQLAIDLNKGMEDYFDRRDEIIRTYKEQGRRKEIQKALEEISIDKKETTIPEDLCYLYGRFFDDYIHDIEICQQFATRNREKIAEVLIQRAGLVAGEGFGQIFITDVNREHIDQILESVNGGYHLFEVQDGHVELLKLREV
jgi:RNA-splicing ligase RtcB